MVRLAKKHDVITVVNHLRRWSRKYIRARDLIARGEIGVPESVVATFSGKLIHTGTHAFDMMRFWFGDVVAVQGIAEPGFELNNGLCPPGRIEDFGGSGSMQFANGAVGTINGRSKNYFTFEFEILGSDGAIRIGNSTPLTKSALKINSR